MNDRARGFPVLVSLVVMSGAALFLARRSTLRELESERRRLEQQSAEWSNRPVATASVRTTDLPRTNAGLSTAELSELLRLRNKVGRLRDNMAKATNEIVRLTAPQPPPTTNGAPGGNADVTSAVRAFIAAGSNSVVAGNALAESDPAYGVIKRLRVEYNLGGQAHTDETTEGASLEIPPGAEVTRAVFGDFPTLDPTKEFVDVTVKVTAILANGATSVTAANELAGFDPAPMIGKVLSVQLVVGGTPQVIQANEGQPLDIPVGATVVQAIYGNLRGQKRQSPE